MAYINETIQELTAAVDALQESVSTLNDNLLDMSEMVEEKLAAVTAAIEADNGGTTANPAEETT